MTKHNEILREMKSVMVFDSHTSQDETDRKWVQWYASTRSAVRDKAVPNAVDTRKMLHAK